MPQKSVHRTPVIPTVLLAAALAAAGCGKSADAGAKAGTAGIATDIGVSDTEITMGVMTDKSGPFKIIALAALQGTQIWTDEANAAGGVCGRQIKLEIRDHGFKAETAKVQFPELEPKVLGFMQLLGSAVNAALKQDVIGARTTAAALSWSSEILDNPYVIILGTTYDLEMINGLSYLRDEGMLNDGDTIGHIYIDGEYGANGLRGAEHFAKEHGLKIEAAKVTSSDADMTNIVTGFKGDKVKAIALTTSPAQTASVAGANAALGLEVPLVGNNPAFIPQLLEGPARDALSRLYLVASSVPFGSDVPKAVEVAKTYKERFSDLPNYGVPYGYAVGEIWGQLLRKACENKDLTRDGIVKAREQSTDLGTENLMADLDFSSTGSPAAREVYVAVPDKTIDGGLRQVKALFSSPDAESYVAPHEKRDEPVDGATASSTPSLTPSKAN